jgi:rhamnosyltransferase
MEWLSARNCTLLFTFDQDSVVPDDYFVKMIETCSRLPTQHFLLGPKIFDINVDRYIPLLVMKRFGVTLTPMTDEDKGLMLSSSIISSGSVMSAATYHSVGAFCEDYFIDQVDTEYCFRAHRKGVPIYIDTALVMRHEIGKRIDRKIGFFKFIQWNYVPFRQYYSARNCIHVSRRYAAHLPSALLINLITLGQFLSIILYESNKLRKLSAMAAGIFDGLLGRYGSIEACHPRVSALCTRNPRLKQA